MSNCSTKSPQFFSLKCRDFKYLSDGLGAPIGLSYKVEVVMQRQYFLSRNGSHVGPYTFDDVLKRLSDREHTWTDYVYDDVLQDWIVLMEHPQFTERFNQGWARPAARPIPSSQSASSGEENSHREKAWFLLKDENNYGPFSVLDIVQMLQEKSLYEFDWVWKHGMRAWKRLAEVDEFKPENIRSLRDSKLDDVSEVFFRRRYARVQYGCTLIVHNNKRIFRGKSLEISEGGAGIIVEHNDFEPGQSLYLHFQPGNGVPPFNAVCSVVSKKWVSEDNQNPSVKYGVKFTSLSQAVRESIRDFTNTRVKAA